MSPRPTARVARKLAEARRAEAAEEAFTKPAGGTGLTVSQFNQLAPAERCAILISTIRVLTPQFEAIRDQLEDTNNLLRLEIMHSGGDRAVGNDGEVVTIERRYVHIYDYEVLSELQQHLTPEQYDRAIAVTPEHTVIVPEEKKVDKNALNMLAKTSDTVREIVQRGTKTQTIWGRLKFLKKL